MRGFATRTAPVEKTAAGISVTGMTNTARNAPATTAGGERLEITVLGSGSEGNALVIRAGRKGVLIDAGFSARELRRRLAAAAIPESCLQGIVITHEHEDHIGGVRVFTSTFDLPVYTTRLTGEAMKYARKAPKALTIFTAGAAFSIGDFTFEPFSIPHDASDPVGFAVHWRHRKIGVVTDLGHASSVVCDRLRECDLLVIESNHDVRMLMNSTRPWPLKHRIAGKHGHLSNDDCMVLLKRILHERTRHLILAHASRECNRYDLIEQVARQCLTLLGRTDLTPLVARQAEALPTLGL